MSLQDRHAKSANKAHTARQLTTRVTMEELRGQSSEKGTTAEQIRGAVPIERGIEQVRGVPAHTHAPIAPQEPSAPACSAITKKGMPCQAAPIKGETLCVGHERAAVRN